MTNKTKKITFSAVVILFLAIGFILFRFNHATHDSKPVTTADQQAWQFPVMEKVSEVLKGYKGIATSVSPQGRLLWEKGDYLVYLHNADNVSVHLSPSDNINREMMDDPLLNEIDQKIATVFKADSYVQDVTNTDHRQYYSNIKGFHKDDVYCTVTIMFELEIACANNFDTEFNKQKPILDALDLDGQEVAVDISQEVDHVVGVSASPGYTGALFYVKHENGKYTKLYGPSQDTPLCSVMDELKIPVQLYGECYDSVTDKIIRR